MIIDGINLPELDALKWTDEYDWSDIAQTQDRSVTGSQIIQEQAKLFGRKITLSGKPDNNWITRANLDAINAKKNILDHKFLVTLPDGQVFTVMFNRSGNAGSLKATQLFDWEGIPGNDTNYTIQTLRLITVEP
jgi:hypothetical protein